MKKIGIIGSKGRMGKAVIANITKYKNHFSEILEFYKNSDLTLKEFIKNSDIIIDFSSKELTEEVLKLLKNESKKIIICTTGHDTNILYNNINKITSSNSVIYAANTSISVNLIAELSRKIADIFPDYNIQIKESHHIHKKDSPSGTAIMLKNLINKSHPHKEIEICSKREGEIIGEHEVIFSNNFEKISINHTAISRELFADGAIKAAIWLSSKEAGLYKISDIFSL